jgi:3'-phosphoadenosine 5'-phosphosulfate sulfotransferase (PAPS reductase)/FAD synthetase
MLWRVLQSNGGLPDETVVCFANTGKEDEATLQFVQDCADNWGVAISWVEYRNSENKFCVVDVDIASRKGEPFASLIRARGYLPNSRTRFCTSELKIRTMHRYLRSLGWTEWDQMIGIRADEARRIVKIRNRSSNETIQENMVIPLADAGVTVQDVSAFWEASPFDLGLRTYNGVAPAGNCDLCFLKANGKIQSLINEKPERALWWIEQEDYCKTITRTTEGALFHIGRPSYRTMYEMAGRQSTLFSEDETIACFCGD